jgi:hypothetical protein
MVQKCSSRKHFTRWIVAVIYGFSFLSFVFTRCVQYTKYIPDPEKDIDLWVTNFARQRSFDYEYEMKMRFVSVEAKGYCEVGKGERLSGFWYGDDKTQKFEYVGLGDAEYSRKGSEWERHSRGEQSDVFTQITRIVTADKFEYQGFDDGYWYRFMANVPFLEPLRRKEMIGIMKISSDNFLPLYIWAGLPDSSTFWTAHLSGYNSSRRVRPPTGDRKDYLVRAGPDKRLDLLGVDYRIKKTKQGLLVNVPGYYELEDVEVMLRPGGLVLYGVVPQGKDAVQTGYMKGDPDKPVFLSGSLMTGHEVRSAELRFDARSTPYLSLKLRKKHAMPATVAFEVDSILVASVAIDTSRKLNRIDLYPDMQYHEMEILRAYVLQPLGAFEIESSGGVIH